MKLSSIVALTITLSVVVEGTWWAAAVQPVILGLGAVLAAIDLDVLDLSSMPFINKNEATDVKAGPIETPTETLTDTPQSPTKASTEASTETSPE